LGILASGPRGGSYQAEISRTLEAGVAFTRIPPPKRTTNGQPIGLSCGKDAVDQGLVFRITLLVAREVPKVSRSNEQRIDAFDFGDFFDFFNAFKCLDHQDENDIVIEGGTIAARN